MRQCRKMVEMFGLAASGVALWLSIAAPAAGAAARSRGLGEAHLVSDRLSSGGAATSANALTVGGTDIMAAFVAGMAVLALGFLIVTFVRRRMVVA